jgi:hypothetical protein
VAGEESSEGVVVMVMRKGSRVVTQSEPYFNTTLKTWEVHVRWEKAKGVFGKRVVSKPGRIFVEAAANQLVKELREKGSLVSQKQDADIEAAEGDEEWVCPEEDMVTPQLKRPVGRPKKNKHGPKPKVVEHIYALFGLCLSVLPSHGVSPHLQAPQPAKRTRPPRSEEEEARAKAIADAEEAARAKAIADAEEAARAKAVADAEEAARAKAVDDQKVRWIDKLSNILDDPASYQKKVGQCHQSACT